MSFDAKQESVSGLLNNAVYQTPRNQRKYVWDKVNWNELWTDIIFSAENKHTHFIGSIVLKNERKFNNLDYYIVIDGQQRVMTISIFILAIMIHLIENNADDDYKGCIKFIKAKDTKNIDVLIFDSEYHISYKKFADIITSEGKYNFKTLDSFVKINTINAKDALIGRALSFFYNTIKEHIKNLDSKIEEILKIRNALLEMSYVRIQANSEEDSYTIFEILNARGQSLGDHDLLKNYIMRYIHPSERRDEVKNVWDDISNGLGERIGNYIKHYASHKYFASNEERKTPYKHIKNNTHVKDVENLLNDIHLKSKYYSKISFPQKIDKNDDIFCTDIEYDVFSFFRKCRHEQFRPILLTLMHQHEIQNIGLEQYNSAIIFLHKFFICYNIIGKEKSNKLTDSIYKYAPLLEKDFLQDTFVEFVTNIKARIPNSDWFNNAFTTIGYSNHTQLFKEANEKRRAKLVLELLERHISNRNDGCEFTIEHILPDSESADNARIGNLIPLEMELNERCANKRLKEKLNIYKQSNFATARKFAERYSTEDFKISSRSKHLAKIFYDEILQL